MVQITAQKSLKDWQIKSVPIFDFQNFSFQIVQVELEQHRLELVKQLLELQVVLEQHHL